MALAPDLSRHPVLVVDDEQDNLDVVRFAFRKVHPLHFARSGAEALAALEQLDASVVVSDLRMPGMDGLELLRRVRSARPGAVGVLLTAYAEVEVLRAALNEGLVYRYVAKPFSADELGLAIRGAVERAHLQQENARLLAQLADHNAYLAEQESARFDAPEIVGAARALEQVMNQLRQVAPTPATVLLRGESGTGKELLARAIHRASPRADRPFVRVNCAALAASLLETELFGHEKGAFTGAIARRAGRFELAEGGTLFLDEIGDLAPELQVKLLRVLQEREFERVGGTETLKADVRVVAATHQDLERAMAAGTFREDLYYRLSVFPLFVPPLRERAEDIEPLAESFLARFARGCGKRIEGFEDGALEKLLAHAWPGNVRELENVVERAVILCQGRRIESEQLDFGRRLVAQRGPAPSVAAASAPLVAPPSGGLPGELEALERARLVEALARHHGRKADVARELGINRTTLYYRLEKLGLKPPPGG